jgi:methylated-DNA-[protein]-cysteine S-methyltransferase
MGANPLPVVIPCHRVLASHGKLGGFSAPVGGRPNHWLLEIEGVTIGAPPGQMAFVF